MLLRILLVSPLLFLLGCSTIGPNLEAKKSLIELKWVNPLSFGNKGFRRSQRMKPLVLKTQIIQGDGFSGIYSTDKANGHTLWKFSVANGVEGGAVASQDSVFFGGGDGNFYSVDLNTGKENWRFPTKAQVLSAPELMQGIVYFLVGNNTLYALDIKTGQQKWLYRRAQTTNLTVRGGSRPVIFGGRLYVGMSDGYLVALDPWDGGLFWERPLNQKGRFIDVDATPVIENGRIYVSSYDGALFCLSLNDGQVIWKYNEGGSQPVLLLNEVVYFPTSRGQVFALDALSGKEKWRYSLGKRGVASGMSSYKGLLVFGESDGVLRLLSAETGKESLSFNPGRGVSAEPSVEKNGRVYFISNEGYLYGVELVRK